jgi:hypothetical protein
MNCGWRWRRALAVALAGAASATAQPRPNGLYLTTPLGLSYGYDNNFISNGQELSDKVSILTGPSLSWKKSTHRSRFSMEYQPEFEIFSNYRDLDAWNHSAIVRYNYQFSGRMSLDAGNFFLSTIDPSRALDNSLLLLPLGLFHQNSVYGELAYRLDRKTKFAFRLDNSVTSTSLTGDAAGKLNQVSAGATASVERVIDIHHAVSANVGNLWVRPFDTRLFGSASAVQIVNGGYDYTPNPGLAIRLQGGLVRGNPTAFTGSAAVEKKLRGLWLAAGYRRYLNFFGGVAQTGPALPGTGFAPGLAPDSIFQVVSLRAWGNVTKNLSLEMTGQRALIGLNQQFRPIKGGVGQLRLDYKITNRLGLFAITEYYGQNLNDFAGMPMARSRYFGGVSITLTRPPAAEKKTKRRGPPPDDPKKTGEPIPEER